MSIIESTSQTGSSSVHGGGGAITNVAVQEICPTDASDHLAMGTYDAVGYALAIDALTHVGPADPKRIDPTVCAQPFQPGVDPATYLAYDKDWYDGSIRALDAEIARLFERLRAGGLDDRTAVVFMSDHGEEFQDHGRMWHGQSAYGELAHVPLVIRWPEQIPAGTRVDELVESIDIMPTVLDFSQLAHPAGIQGQTLVPLLRTKLDTAVSWKKRPAITEKQPMTEDADAPDPRHERDASWQSFAINDGDWKLIHHTIRPPARPEFELFDARRDVLDRHDVAAQHPDVVQRLAKALDGWHQMALASRLKPDTETTKNLTPEQLRKLRSLGYVK